MVKRRARPRKRRLIVLVGTTGIPGLAESADLIKTSSPRRTYFPGGGGGYALLVLVTRRRELGGRFGSGIPRDAPGLFPEMRNCV